jgi:hypothetical protein
MNYGNLVPTISDDLIEAVELILNPEIDPDTRTLNLEILLRSSGREIYDIIYAMNAYDFGVEYTTGIGIDDYYYTLAKQLSDSVSLGGHKEMIAKLEDWMYFQVDKGQFDAFKTARDNGQHPTAERIEPWNCCSFCKDREWGKVENPDHEMWRRHDNCRGIIKTQGYRSRNGRLSGRGWKKYRR